MNSVKNISVATIKNQRKYILIYHSLLDSILIVAEVPETPSKKAKVKESEVPSTEPASSPSIVISEALAKFFGTSEKEMLQSEVYKRIEEYIKTEGLEVGECLFPTSLFYAYTLS